MHWKMLVAWVEVIPLQLSAVYMHLLHDLLCKFEESDTLI